jgi:hypothetical protein
MSGFAEAGAAIAGANFVATHGLHIHKRYKTARAGCNATIAAYDDLDDKKRNLRDTAESIPMNIARVQMQVQETVKSSPKKP